MQAGRGEQGGVGRSAIAALLTLALLLQVTLSGHGALWTASPSSDPATVLCTSHPDPASIPDENRQAPAGPPDLCCTLFCGSGGCPPPVRLPVASPVPSSAPRQALIREHPADEGFHPTRAHIRQGARAPPVPA